jgi:hypothetical protein
MSGTFHTCIAGVFLLLHVNLLIPAVALVVCQALLVDDIAACIKGKLVCDVHRSDAGVRDSVNLFPGED